MEVSKIGETEEGWLCGQRNKRSLEEGGSLSDNDVCKREKERGMVFAMDEENRNMMVKGIVCVA
ncbi:dihydroorotate dehydrogenase [Sesbania bispinosa]|nr:dihydroorotate dehydrogenase [Sesbania bispinosa]